MKLPGPSRHRLRLGSTGGTVLLASILLIPALVFYLGWATSLSLGTMLAAVALIAVAALQRVPRLDAPPPAYIVAVLLAGVAIHAVAASLFQPFDGIRAISSLVPLALVILGGSAWARLLSTASSRTLDRMFLRCFALMVVIALLPSLGLTFPQLGGQRLYDKPLFPFTEPSHFALLFIPLLMHVCVSSSGRRRLLMLLAGAGVALTLKNLTLVVGLIVVTSVCLSRRLLPLVLLAVLAVSQMDLSYYAARLDFGGEVQNLSNLVYIQGWQLIEESLDLSGGWGLGFQQLGVQGSNTPTSEIIYALVGDYANLLDGGFTLAKVTSEFGVFGLCLIGVYLGAAWSAWRSLRLACEMPGTMHALDVFACSVIVGYFVELFIRGTGYFTGTAILLCAALSLRYSRRRAQLPRLSAARSSKPRARRVRFVLLRPRAAVRRPSPCQ